MSATLVGSETRCRALDRFRHCTESLRPRAAGPDICILSSSLWLVIQLPVVFLYTTPDAVTSEGSRGTHVVTDVAARNDCVQAVMPALGYISCTRSQLTKWLHRLR